MRVSGAAVVALAGVLSLAPGSARAPARAEPGPRISGRVLFAGDTTSAVRVSLYRESTVFERGRRALTGAPETEPVVRTIADREGRFSLEAPAPGLWRLRVEAPGRLSFERRLYPLVSDVRLPDLELTPDVGTRVQVLGPGGAPVAGARLRAAAERLVEPLRPAAATGWTVPERHASTSDDGTAVLPAARGERLRIEALARGYGSPAVASGAGSVTLRLVAGSLRTVVALAPDGEPLSEALIRVGESGWPVGLTSADGELRLSTVAGRPLRLRAITAAGFRARRVISDPAMTAEPIVLRLVAPAMHRGLVAPGAGRLPAEGAVVWSDQDPAGAVRTRQDGRFVLAIPPWRDAPVRAAARGFVEAETELSPGRADLATPLRLTLTPASAVTGRVLDPAGRPVEGAQVVLVPESSEIVVRSQPAPARATTGADGGFRLEPIAAGRGSVQVEAAGYAPLERLAFDVRPPHPVRLGDLHLDPGLELAVWVAEHRRHPVAGADVSARRSSRWGGEAVSCVTDPSGGCRLAPLVAGAPIAIAVRAGATEVLVEDVVPSNEPLLVDCPRSLPIAGRVVDEDGRGLAGARIEGRAECIARLGDRPLQAVATAEAQSGAQGGFVLHGLPPGRLEVAAELDGYLPLHRASGGVSEEGLILRLGTGVTLDGRVLGSAGEPIAGARVTVDRAAGHGGPPPSAISDEAGGYRLTGLQPGPVEVEGRHRDLVADRRSVRLVPGENSLDLNLGDGVQVSGRVIDAEGAPVAGARVTLSPLSEAGWSRISMTGADGGFAIEPVAPASYRLTAVADGLAPAEPPEPLEVGPEGLSAIEVILPSGARLTGQLLGLDDGGTAAVRVSALGIGGLRREGEVTADGRYVIDGLAPGPWLVRAERASASGAEGRVRLAPDQAETTLDLEFGAGHRLHGIVLVDGLPIAGVRAELMATESAWAEAVRTDSQGGFTVEGVPAGRVILRIARRAAGLVYAEEIVIRADREWSVDLATAQVSGRVLYSDGLIPASGAVVSLIPRSPLAAGLEAQTLTGADGAFRFPLAAAGAYRLRAVPSTGLPTETELVVAPGVPVSRIELLLD